MNKLLKILNKEHKKYLYKDKSIIRNINLYKSFFKDNDLKFENKNDFSIIENQVMITSFNNMTKIQNKYFEISEDLGDVWSNLNYHEKQRLLYLRLNPFLDSLKCFYVENSRYFITYFDRLLNAYYDHNFLLFENLAYKKYLYNFKALIQKNTYYNYLALKANFSEVKFIYGNQGSFVLYHKDIQRFYLFDDQISLGFNKELNEDQIVEIAKLFYNKDNLNLIEYIINNDLASNKTQKKLKRLKRKIKWNLK